MTRFATPAAILLTLVAIYSGPDVGGLALAAVVTWALAIGLES